MVNHDDERGNEFICGALASFVNILVTFPMYKVMFRQQLYGMRFRKAVNQLHSEGIYYLYRGIGPPLMTRTVTVSLMFGAYSQYLHAYQRALPSHPWVLGHVTAAMAAGTTEALFSPFERIQVLLQTPKYHNMVANTTHAFTTLRRFGIREYYRGLSAILLRNGPSNVFFLGLREPLQRSLPHSQSQVGVTVANFVSGAGLGAMLSTIFYPLNTVKNHMQSHLGGDFTGIRHNLIVVFNQRGRQWRKMFRGVHLNYTRSVMSWGIINAVYELFRNYLSVK